MGSPTNIIIESTVISIFLKMPEAIGYFYEHINYGGQCYPVYDDNSWVGNCQNDKYSSCKVKEGYHIRMYQHISYGGISYLCKEDIPDFTKIGWNDIVSSFKVIKICGYFYEHINYGGSSYVCDEDKPNFCNIGWNDVVSSYKVIDVAGTFYEHINYGGKKYHVYADNSWVGSCNNDKYSSVKINPGYDIEMFEHINYGGSRYLCRTDMANFCNIGWNDIVSSYKVHKE